MATKRFHKGSSTYLCNVCGRRTRDTGDNGSCDLCPECYTLAGIENEISDGWATAEARAQEIRDIVTAITGKGGRATEWAALLRRTVLP